MILTGVEKLIKSKKQGEFIYPLYNGYSLYNVIPTILNLFGISHDRIPLKIDSLQNYASQDNKIIFFLIDGFGYDQFEKFYKNLQFLNAFTSKGLVSPITSVFPSTTAAALTTITTGLTPQEHGLVEWNLYIKEIDEIIQTLPFSYLGKSSPDEILRYEGVSPKVLLENPKTIFQELQKNGIKSYIFYHHSTIKSTYSSLTTNGAICMSYNYLSDLLVQLKETVDKENARTLFYVYWPSIDTQQHKFGPYSEEHILELKTFFEALYEGLIDPLKKDMANNRNIIVLISSDHGQIKVDPDTTIYLNNDKELIDAFEVSKKGKKILPWGSARDVFLLVDEKNKNKIISYLRELLNKKAEILETKDGIKRGLFGVGTPSKRFLDRVGNVMILPYDNNTVWYEHIKGEPFDLLGYHGGLTEEEMLIPFGIAKLKDLV